VFPGLEVERVPCYATFYDNRVFWILPFQDTSGLTTHNVPIKGRRVKQFLKVLEVDPHRACMAHSERFVVACCDPGASDF